MFINATGYYIPEKRLDNKYFSDISGMSEDWYYKRTGIATRVRATEKETIGLMSIEAVRNIKEKLPYDITDVDLIIFASYTPTDTVATTAHVIQREFGIKNAKAFYISSACSSAINAMEIIYSFFLTNSASKALLICADRNSSYSHDDDIQSGHLWGDAAAVFSFSNTPSSNKEAELIDIDSKGLGHIGEGPSGISLEIKGNGLEMQYGRDVFAQACKYITQSTREILRKNGYGVSDLSYFIGHQSNMRIIKQVRESLGICRDRVLTNLEELGNTGCASAPLVFAQNYDRFQSNDIICMSVFGGGYSTGTGLFIMR